MSAPDPIEEEQAVTAAEQYEIQAVEGALLGRHFLTPTDRSGRSIRQNAAGDILRHSYCDRWLPARMFGLGRLGPSVAGEGDRDCEQCLLAFHQRVKQRHG